MDNFSFELADKTKIYTLCVVTSQSNRQQVGRRVAGHHGHELRVADCHDVQQVLADVQVPAGDVPGHVALQVRAGVIRPTLLPAVPQRERAEWRGASGSRGRPAALCARPAPPHPPLALALLLLKRLSSFIVQPHWTRATVRVCALLYK